MKYSKDAIISCLNDSKEFLDTYALPLWDKLPEIELYMDQVIELVNGYLNASGSFAGADVAITRPMINNYVKLKMMPAPIKKKYGRIHLAYIIIICTLKQTLNISTIQKILPTEIPREEVIYLYNSFVKNQKAAYGFVSSQADEIAAPIVTTFEDNSERIDDLIMQIASTANVLKCLIERVMDYPEIKSE